MIAIFQKQNSEDKALGYWHNLRRLEKGKSVKTPTPS